MQGTVIIPEENVVLVKKWSREKSAPGAGEGDIVPRGSWSGPALQQDPMGRRAKKAKWPGRVSLHVIALILWAKPLDPYLRIFFYNSFLSSQITSHMDKGYWGKIIKIIKTDYIFVIGAEVVISG